MSKPLILIGAGGHCKALIDVIDSGDEFSIAGILGAPSERGKKLLGYSIVGTDADIDDWIASGVHFIIAIGQIKSPEPRSRVGAMLADRRALVGTVTASSAHVSKHSVLGLGSMVFRKAHIGPDSHIGEHCIINTGAIIEHDCRIDSYCHISTGAILNGGVTVGSGSFIGSGAILREGVTIGSNCIVGAGVPIKFSVPDGQTVR